MESLREVFEMNVIEQYESFHDWYIMGVAVNMDHKVVELHLMFDNKRDHVRVQFCGATRCWVNDFLIQNIVYSIRILSTFDTDEYKKALNLLDKSYSWGRGKPLKNIAVIEPTLGADVLIEFDTVEVKI